MALKFDGWPCKTIGHIFFSTSSFVHHFKSIGEFKLELQSRNTQFGPKSVIFFVPCDLEIWWMTLKNKRAPFLYSIKLFPSFQSHRWIQIWVTVWKCSIRVKISSFFVPSDLKIWCITLKNYRAPLLYYTKLCASFQTHWSIQTWVTVWKHSIQVKIWVFCPVWPWNLTNDLEKQ